MGIKKPHLYTMHRPSWSDQQRSGSFYKITIWNWLYYRKGDRRQRYAPSHINNIYADAPWHVDCTYPQDFISFEKAIAYATSPAAYNEVAHNGWRRWNADHGVPYGH